MNAQKMEDAIQSQLEELNFDAHEFDGLRESARSSAATWLRQTDRFVRDNPWLCIGIAAAAACALGWSLAPRSRVDRDPEAAD